MAKELNMGSRANGNFTVIDPKIVQEARERIRKNMAPKIKEFNRKMNESMDYASKRIYR